MSAKWRALQHRHRYTYSAVIFPKSFIEALQQTPSVHFYSELQQFVSLNSTYSQLNHAKKLASSFSELLSNVKADDESISTASRFYLEILLLENSQPLHRTLLSVLVKCNNFHTLIQNCFRQICEEYGENGKRFCVSRAALSMMSTPKLGYLVEIVDECAVLVGLNVVLGLSSVLAEINDWSRPSPVVMEQCQEALSCMYYLLQRFPSKFVNAGSNVLERILVTVLSILKSESFSRDCLVAAGVSFCVALQVCLSPQEIGLFIMGGIFNESSVVCSKLVFKGVLEKIPFKGNLVDELSKFSSLSRLCLVRGILTAVSRTVLNTGFVVSNDSFGSVRDSGDNKKSIKMILYDAILPELCNFCENPIDSHFSFHALTVMQICLQQVKTSMLDKNGSLEVNYDLISEDIGTRLLQIVWNNLEDPLNQTVKQVQLIFDLFLDIQANLHWAEGSDTFNLFTRKVAFDLLRLGPRCKGRYIPLASLTKRLGARTLLSMSPDLLFETIKAYIDDDVCCASTTFLKCFLQCLRDEYWSSDGIENGYNRFRGHCLPPLLSGLASGHSRLRSNLNTYALPVLLELDVDAIFLMLAFIGIRCGLDNGEVFLTELDFRGVSPVLEERVAVLVSLFKVSRFLALLEGDIDWCKDSLLSPEDVKQNLEKKDATVCIKGIEIKVPEKYLVLALTHIDETLRIDAAESLFINPKTASLPSSLELSLMKVAVPLNMRCCSTSFQMKWTSLFRKFFSRVRTALERQVKQGSWQPLARNDTSRNSVAKRTGDMFEDRADELFNFMKWLSCFLFFSCYPSAPYERKIMAMELLLIMLNVWSIVFPSEGTVDAVSPQFSLYPYSKGLLLPESTLLLVGSIVDSWDRLRVSSFRILLHFPSPLPGIHSEDMVSETIVWAKKLVYSPRVRESDAGALTLRLIFRKYVLELGWVVNASSNDVSAQPLSKLPSKENKACKFAPPAIEYLRSLIDWLDAVVQDGEKDLSEACKNSFVHGVLLTLRYTFEELDWDSDAIVCSISEMKGVLEKILELVRRITSVALWVVSADAWYLPDDMDEMGDEALLLEEVPHKMDEADKEQNTTEVQEGRQTEQIVMVGCWLAMKEVSLLLGTIIRKVPLPTSDVSESGSQDVHETVLSNMTSGTMLDLKQLEVIGNHFLEVLLKMKHNGAIDKTRAGFTALCNRLLCSNDARFCKLTESWMEQLMERTIAKGQTVDDLLRRSAGIPAAFIAFFLSEPQGTPKKLLPRALRWLVDVANKYLTDHTEANSFSADTSNGFVETGPATFSIIASDVYDAERISKIRDEGVVPTVHAFNVLKAAFNDTNLATDISGFSAEAMIISIRCFSSPHWEVRNSACLAYTALVRRMIGFLNVHKRASARRAITGIEFFHRYPPLHSFLFNELKIATESLLDGSSEHLRSNLAKVVHPSLCPVLILLSRLKPSPIASEAGDPLDPFLFMPFIRKCSVQSNLRIRVLASRALTGLVSNEKLPLVLLNIASELPGTGERFVNSELSMPSNRVNSSFNSLHGMLSQLSSLLETNCRDLADVSQKDKILAELIRILASRSWIGSPERCPCSIINSCFLKVLDNMLGVARTCQTSKNIYVIWELLWRSSSVCLDLGVVCAPAYFDPTTSNLRKQAACSYFNCVYQTSKEAAEEYLLVPSKGLPGSNLSMISVNEISFSRFKERLIRSFSDTSYEVRIATLKWFLLFLKTPEYSEIKRSCLTSMDLQTTMVKLLTLDNNHKCLNYILKIIYSWSLQEYQNNGEEYYPKFFGDMDIESVLQFWNKVVSLYKVTRQSKTREMLLCCMGVCIKQFAGSLSSSVVSLQDVKVGEVSHHDPSDMSKLSAFYECISYYVDLIEQHSDASEPVNMRRAAAESMIASGLLDQAEVIAPFVYNNQIPDGNLCSYFKHEMVVNIYAHKVLDLWFSCIRLLEDEDESLRKKLALDVQNCFRCKSSERTGAVPSQVEQVIEKSFNHLSSIFGRCLDYLDFLCRRVVDSASHACVISEGDLIKRVFDKEIDNHHEEKLLICQICCYHLEKLPTSGEGGDVRDILQKWRRQFGQKLVLFAKDYVAAQGGLDWIGGVGNHKDAFLPLYANLLAFYSLSNCIFNGKAEDRKSMLREVEEIGEAIQPFLTNPLISNLLLLVVTLHNKMISQDLIKKTTDESAYTYSTPALSTSSFNRYAIRNPSTVGSWDATTASLNDGDDEVDDQLDLPGRQGCGIPCWSRRSTPKYRGGGGSCYSPSFSDTLRRKGSSILCGSQTMYQRRRRGSSLGYTKRRHSSRNGAQGLIPLLTNGDGQGLSSMGTGHSDDELSTNFGELDLEALSRLDGKRWSTSCRSQDGLELVALKGEDGEEGSPENIRSLSQKYRPMFFEELIGQNIVVQSLVNAISRGRIAPVYLFQGPRGTGKTSTARIFTAALNCLASEETKPCGVCRECADFMSGKCKNLREVDGTNKKGIDKVKYLLKNLAASQQSSSGFKVFVVDECHLLPSKTWLAFLKFLEEPPLRVVFIFITTDLDNVPRAVLSRCQKYLFNKIRDGDIVLRLKKISSDEDLDVESEALDLIALNADGSLRDAETMLDQLSLLGKRITTSLVNDLIGVVSDEKLLELLELAMSSDTAETVKRARELLDSGVDPIVLMSQLATLIMDIIAGTHPILDAKQTDISGGKSLNETELDRLKHALKLLSEAEKQLRVSSERSTWFTATLLQLGSATSLDRTHSGSSHRLSSKTTEEDPSSTSREAISLRQRTDIHHAPCKSGSPSSFAKANRRNSASRELTLSSMNGEPLGGPHNDTKDSKTASRCPNTNVLDDIWIRCIDKCHSNTLKQLLHTCGTLLSISEVEGGFVAHIAFRDSKVKLRAERFLSSITNSFETILRSNVEVRLVLLPDAETSDDSGKPITLINSGGLKQMGSQNNMVKREIAVSSNQDPLQVSRSSFNDPESKMVETFESASGNAGTSSSKERISEIPVQRIESIIREQRLETAWLQAMEKGTPGSMSRLKPERNQVLPQDGLYHNNQLEPINSRELFSQHWHDDLNEEIRSLKMIDGKAVQKDQTSKKGDSYPISPSLLHNGIYGSNFSKESMGYESGSGAGGCFCWNNSRPQRRGKVKQGTPVRPPKGGRFLWFGECAKPRRTESRLRR